MSFSDFLNVAFTQAFPAPKQAPLTTITLTSTAGGGSHTHPEKPEQNLAFLQHYKTYLEQRNMPKRDPEKEN